MAAPQDFIGGYHLLELLGEGGMGKVFAALNADGQEVAFKLFHPWVCADERARARLQREVEALQKIRSPYICAILDAELDDDPLFLVTELISGPALDTEVEENGPYNLADLTNLASGIAQALDDVHASGLVHRDLKPSNVMLSERGPVLIDFGIAQALDDSRLTRTGLVTGTPGFLDPLVLTGQAPSPAGDWWSWAALLLYALTGRQPFGTGGSAAILARVESGRPDTRGLPRPLARVLQQALSPDPATRLYPTEVLDVLEALVAEDHARAQAVADAALTRALPLSTTLPPTSVFTNDFVDIAEPGATTGAPGGLSAELSEDFSDDFAGDFSGSSTDFFANPQQSQNYVTANIQPENPAISNDIVQLENENYPTLLEQQLDSPPLLGENTALLTAPTSQPQNQTELEIPEISKFSDLPEIPPTYPPNLDPFTAHQGAISATAPSPAHNHQKQPSRRPLLLLAAGIFLILLGARWGLIGAATLIGVLWVGSTCGITKKRREISRQKLTRYEWKTNPVNLTPTLVEHVSQRKLTAATIGLLPINILKGLVNSALVGLVSIGVAAATYAGLERVQSNFSTWQIALLSCTLALLVAWATPLSRDFRTGSRWIAAYVAPNRKYALILFILLLTAGFLVSWGTSLGTSFWDLKNNFWF